MPRPSTTTNALFKSLKSHPTAENADVIASLYEGLGYIDYKRGQYKEAEILFKKAIRIEEALPHSDDKNLTVDYTNLANLYRAMHRLTDAQEADTKAKELQRGPQNNSRCPRIKYMRLLWLPRGSRSQPSSDRYLPSNDKFCCSTLGWWMSGGDHAVLASKAGLWEVATLLATRPAVWRAQAANPVRGFAVERPADGA